MYIINNNYRPTKFDLLLIYSFIQRDPNSIYLELIVAGEVLGVLYLLDELLLFEAAGALDAAVGQDALELLHPELAEVLGLELLGLEGELDAADLVVGLVDALADAVDGDAGREGLGDVALDGVDVVADLALAGSEVGPGAVLAHGGLDLGLLLDVGLVHGIANVLHDLDADWR